MPCAGSRRPPTIARCGNMRPFDRSRLPTPPIVSSALMPSVPHSRRRAARCCRRGRSRPARRSRLRIASATTSLKVWSAAAVIAVASARPSGAVRVAAAHRAARRGWSSSSSCASAASSSTSKRAATLASNGNWCSSRVQKAWMVCTLSPPGVSSASANSRRARARSAGVRMRDRHPAGSPRRASASSSAVQCRSSSNTRFAMLAAAALVKVMQRIFAGLDAVEQQPDHALRQHVGLARAGIGRDPGRDRRVGRGICSRRSTASGMMRGAFIRLPPLRRRSPPSDHSLTRARWS